MARELTQAARAAKAIRTELKTAFPTVTFKVVSKNFSMGDDVNVSWTDGPTEEEVSHGLGKYKKGHFDGMVDLYEYSNVRTNTPQTKYLFTRREYSRETYAAALDDVNKRYGYALRMAPDYVGYDQASDHPKANGGGYQSEDVYRYLQTLRLLCPTGHATMPGDVYCPECGANLTRDEEVA